MMETKDCIDLIGLVVTGIGILITVLNELGLALNFKRVKVFKKLSHDKGVILNDNSDGFNQLLKKLPPPKGTEKVDGVAARELDWSNDGSDPFNYIYYVVNGKKLDKSSMTMHDVKDWAYLPIYSKFGMVAVILGFITQTIRFIFFR